VLRLTGHTTAKLIIAAVGAIIFFSGCAAPKGEGFAIHLTREDTPPAEMAGLSHIEIADQPIINTSDVIAYSTTTHEIMLTSDAYDRVSNLEIPVTGKSFVVCVDKKPIYWGAFWTPISSLSFDGVTIWKPLGTTGYESITIELGYPSSSFYEGEDPRANITVMKSLEKAGKLTRNPLTDETAQLPHSMKEYELYSWEEDNQWHFTLITGTNRTKTLEEIVSTGDSISESGWVKIQVSGVDEIIDIITRIPQGEHVFWCDEKHLGQATETDIKIQLPPEQIINAITEVAEQCGLNLMVTA